MQLVRNRLKRIDIYSPAEADGYVGKTPSPELLGFVYADVCPVTESVKSESGGIVAQKSAKLILSGSAGVSAGDYADLDGSGPNYMITEVTRSGGTVTARAEAV